MNFTVKGPEGGWYFGNHIDVNQQFMVVSGRQPYSVHVYQSNSPYNMVARMPVGEFVWSLVISDDNTIAVSHGEKNHGYWLTIYHYDGSYTWNVVKKFKLERFGNSLSVYGDILVVGAPGIPRTRTCTHLQSCWRRVGERTNN